MARREARLGKMGLRSIVAGLEIQPIRVEIDREDDGRILASVPDLPGDLPVVSRTRSAIIILTRLVRNGLK